MAPRESICQLNFIGEMSGNGDNGRAFIAPIDGRVVNFARKEFSFMASLKHGHVRPKYLTIFLLLYLILASCGKSDKSESDDSSKDSTPEVSSIIVGEINWVEVTALLGGSPERVNSFAVADLDLPAMGSRCTGFLIGPDVLMTNRHCIPSSYYSTGVTAAFKHEKGVPESGWSKFDCSEFIGNDSALDFALLRCAGNPGAEFGFVELSSQVASAGDDVYVIHQNCDYYSDRDCDWSKKYSVGSVVEVADEVTHNADTLGGSSGSPLFSASLNKVIAIHHAGYGNNGLGRGVENYAVPMSEIVPFIEENFPGILNSEGDDDDPVEDPVEDQDIGDNFSSGLQVGGAAYQKSSSLEEAGDKDVFKFTVNSEAAVKGSIAFSHAAGDLDLKLFSSDGELLKYSNGVSNSEGVEATLQAGSYYFVVYGYRDAVGDYQFDFSLTQSGLVPVSFDPSRNAVLFSSFPKSFNGNIAGDGQLDYYKFELSGRKKVTAELSFSHKKGDLDLYLYDESGERVKYSIGTGNLEKVSLYLNKGSYFLAVKGYQSAKGEYSLQVK